MNFWPRSILNSRSGITTALQHHHESFMVMLWEQKYWYPPQSETPCRECEGHRSTFNHQWFEMWARGSGSSWGQVFNNIMALLLVAKQALTSSRTPFVEVTFNENVSHNSLLVYLFVVVFIKIKFGISRGHLVQPICCNLTTCWEAGSNWVAHCVGLTRGFARWKSSECMWIF